MLLSQLLTPDRVRVPLASRDKPGILRELTTLLVATAGAALAQGQVADTQNKPISWDNWREAKATAEKFDNEGKLVEALQYYLEYARQAEVPVP